MSKNEEISTSPSGKIESSPSSDTKKKAKITEKCQEHNWKPLLFYCNCGKFLCLLCLKNHCHENMNFCDIKTFYNNVLKEMEQILKLIDRYSADLIAFPGNSQNKKLESIIYTKKSLINLFRHREILYDLSLQQIKEVKDNNLFFKISNSITDYLQGIVEANEDKIRKLISD